MVQVDVFWSYSLGAGFALSASRQLLKKHKQQQHSQQEESGPFITSYFITTVLYLALLFAPSGLYLLWQFTSWETMHVLDRNMSPLLVILFAITNVTQGMLGFWAVYALARSGKKYLAYLQFFAGYFFMFFILVHGWDGTGYQRFFSATKEDFLAWQPSNAIQNAIAWLTSDVAITLGVMGIFLIPAMLYFYCRWIIEGYKLEESTKHRTSGIIEWIRIILLIGAVIFIGGLGSAIAASLLIHWIGWILGTLVFLLLDYFIFLRKGGLLHYFYRNLMLTGR